MPSTQAQSKEKKGSNFAIWQHCSRVPTPKGAPIVFCADATNTHVQKCRKIRGLGCVNKACTRARVTQPSPHIFLHICTCRVLQKFLKLLTWQEVARSWDHATCRFLTFGLVTMQNIPYKNSSHSAEKVYEYIKLPRRESCFRNVGGVFP